MLPVASTDNRTNERSGTSTLCGCTRMVTGSPARAKDVAAISSAQRISFIENSLGRATSLLLSDATSEANLSGRVGAFGRCPRFERLGARPYRPPTFHHIQTQACGLG